MAKMTTTSLVSRWKRVAVFREPWRSLYGCCSDLLR